MNKDDDLDTVEILTKMMGAKVVGTKKVHKGITDEELQAVALQMIKESEQKENDG